MGVRLLGKTGRLQTGSTLGSAVGADEEDKSKEQQTTTGEAAFGGGSGAVKPVTQQAAPQTKGSGFTNVQKILKASGTDTGPSRLAQTAAGGVRQAASGAQQALTGAVEKFGKETGESTKAIPTSGTVSNIISGALGGTLSDTDLSTYQKAASGTYAGPTSLQMTPEQQREAAKSSALSRLAGDVSGRSALLQKYVGSPQYGQSKQTLDTLLLGRGGSAALRGALRQGARTEQDIKRQEIVAQEQAKQAQERARGIAEEAKTGLEQAKTGLMGQLETKKQQEAERISGAVDRFLSALNLSAPSKLEDKTTSFIGKDGTPISLENIKQPKTQRPSFANISKKDLEILGLTESDVVNLGRLSNLGIDPSLYLSKTSGDIKKELQALGSQQFASPEQRAAINALGQLAGTSNLGLTDIGSAYNLTNLSSLDIDKLTQAGVDALIGSYMPTDLNKINQQLGAGTDNYISRASESPITETQITQNLRNYLSTGMSNEEFIKNDPIYNIANAALNSLIGTKSTLEQGGVLGLSPAPIPEDQRKDLINHYTNILNNRKNELNNLISSLSPRQFQFTD